MNVLGERHYFKGRVSHSFLALLTAKTIVGVAVGLFGIFLPIFIYEIFGQSFTKTALYFGIGWLLYAFIVAWGARWLNSFGFRRALRYSVYFGGGFYLSLFFANSVPLVYVIPISLLILTLYRILYWVPYHTDFAKFTSKRNRGKELGALFAARHLIGALIPLFAGYVVSRYGFEVLFIIGIAVMIISGIPYLTIAQTREVFSWSYTHTWKQFFSKKRRGAILAFIADGAETTVAIVIWPIFIFQLLGGDFFKVGLISTLILGVTVVIDLVLGKYIDDRARGAGILWIGSIFSSVGWIVKVFVTTAFHIFVAGAYHSLVMVFTRESFDTLTYEMAADQGHYVDEFTVLHEIAINLGRALMLAVSVAVFFWVGLQWTFVLAALAALLLNFLRVQNQDLIPPLDRQKTFS